MRTVVTKLRKYKIIDTEKIYDYTFIGFSKDNCITRFFRLQVYKKEDGEPFLYYIKTKTTYKPYFRDLDGMFTQGRFWKIKQI